MKNNKHWLFGMAALAALFQSGILYAAIENRASILRDGKDIVLLTQPVDPRDLMRGDYVILGYAISSIPRSQITGTPDSDHADIYVAMKPGADGNWQLSRASFQPIGDIAPDEVVLKGQTRFPVPTQPGALVSVNYGIERYYIPEGEGARIDEAQRQRNIQAVVAVSPSGASQIKALRENGQPLYREPLY
ncbi:GDYXXLXY domain-containing protein [Phyllobacterium leguminum]|uniref:Putative membrane-anchored protein n=1 Tax=Phyllobacterium leguminum TaxID=314237 RepID=A0A318T6V5_9HYPH|nr:GDYXXLXY domain-containing protein [Phyllobacterium leguminum]PYE88133.1 putative membrane-anchored protein [Phyllobacterium leguminum]